MLQRDHAVYQTSRRFNRLRASCSPLHQGRTVFRSYANGNNGLLIFSRIDAGKEMVVVVNNTSTSLPLPDIAIDGAPEQARFRNAVLDSQSGSVASGTLRFQGALIEGNSVAVFADENQLSDYDAALGVRLCR